MDIKQWSADLQNLKNIIRRPDYWEEAKTLSLKLHDMVYVSEMSGCEEKTFEDKLWDDLTEYILRNTTNEKGRTILYGLWHSARIEDITMSLLVAGEDQLFEKENWISKINYPIRHTGNSLDAKETLDFSKKINILELKKYRIAVGQNSCRIINALGKNDFKRKIIQSNLSRIINEGAVDNVPSANWLIDFWSRKDVAGILLMPCLRHQLVHLNECFRAKKKGVNHE